MISSEEIQARARRLWSSGDPLRAWLGATELFPYLLPFRRPSAHDWLERFAANPSDSAENAAAARELVERVMDQLSPAARLVITLLEIEDRSLKEIAALTGWSVAVVKIRAFRARAEMRRCLQKLAREKYL